MKCKSGERTLPHWATNTLVAFLLIFAALLAGCESPFENTEPPANGTGNGGEDPAPVSRTVSFHPNGGDGSMEPVSAPAGTLFTLPAAAFTRDGYRFTGWSTSADGELVYADEAEYTVGSTDTTLFANWSTDEYVISYYPNGGLNHPDNPVSYTTETSEIALLPATREGYTFAGWYASAELDGTAITVITQGSTGDVSLYAAWTANVYSITFHANGGEGSMDLLSIATAETTPLTTNAFTRIGYTFTGWSTSADGEVVYADEAPYTMGTAALTLYAVWVEVIFDPGVGPNGTVTSVAVQPDGKIVIAGLFTQVAGVNRGRVARLNPDGTLDTTFATGNGADGNIRTLVRQTDGKLVIGGDFSEIDGVDRKGIARLNSDGSLDTTFNADLGSPGGLWVAMVLPRTDGSLLIGGQFTSVGGTSRSRMARLHSDGTVDTGFDLDSSMTSATAVLADLGDGSVLVVGVLYSEGGLSIENRFARVLADGEIDRSFNPGLLNNDPTSGGKQSDGTIVLGGYFTDVGGNGQPRVARLSSIGALDIGFPAGTGPNGTVYRLMVLDSDKVILAHGASGFTQVDGSTANGIARLNENGSLDTSFDGGTGPNGLVHAIALTPAGRVLIAGAFTSYNGVTRNRIATLNGDGSVQQ